MWTRLQFKQPDIPDLTMQTGLNKNASKGPLAAANFGGNRWWQSLKGNANHSVLHHGANLGRLKRPRREQELVHGRAT